MSFQVKSPGLLTTVQDLGRPGFGPMGVSTSGAADSIALRVGNRLVGNSESSAALEMTLLGGTFLFNRDSVASIAGSDFGPTLDGQPAALWTAFLIRAGQTLAFGPTRTGARCYLCVHGGISVPLFLGSASTHLLSGLGGLSGRALRKGDTLSVGDSSMEFQQRSVPPSVLRKLAPRKILRVTAGPQENWFAQSALAGFYQGTYRVSEESNRMGLRLVGPEVQTEKPRQMITEPVALGAIQIPAGGQPIILFVEQQTTGGYPKIANVISADLSSIGQLRPRDEIRFERVTLLQARQLICEQEQLLRSEELCRY